MPFLLQKLITRNDLRANPDVLYVFGDNEARCGIGGQAGEMRGEPNAVGVATLRAPGMFWTGDDTARQCSVLDADLARVRRHLEQGGVVIFPMDGIGTGIAEMMHRAPATFEYLQMLISTMRRSV